MKRRDFLRSAGAAGAAAGIFGRAESAFAAESKQACPEAAFPQVKDLTAYVARFVVDTQYSGIPSHVMEFDKKAILDALGLARSGSKAETSGMIQPYVHGLAVQN